MPSIDLMRPQLPTLEELTPYLQEIDRNRFYTNFGPLVRRFEAIMAERVGFSAEQVATVSNATIGLTLALEATEVPRGDLCIVPSYTFSASAASIVRAGLIPFFVDVDEDTLGLTPEIALQAMKSAPGNVVAVMPVSPFGRPIDASQWEAFRDKTGVSVVIDAAAAFDGVQGSSIPTVVSLHATKVFGIGEGALVLNSDEAFIERVRELTSFGFPFKAAAGVRIREARVAGTNAKLTEYSAALGLAMWDRWPAHRAQLAEVRERYLNAFRKLPKIEAQPGDDGTWVSATINLVAQSDVVPALHASFKEHGIATRLWWERGCHASEAYKTYPATALPVTERIAQRVIGIPCYSDLTTTDQDRVVEAIIHALPSAPLPSPGQKMWSSAQGESTL